MVENILIAVGGVLAGLGLSGIAYGWRKEILANREERVERELRRADEMLATAEQLTVRYNALTQPTDLYEFVKPGSWRTRWSEFRSRFTPVEQTPDWAAGEVLALATLGTDPVHPDPLPPPPPPRRQPWDRHINRSGWPNASVNPKAVRLVARLADLPNPAALAARLSRLPDPTRVYRTARSF